MTDTGRPGEDADAALATALAAADADMLAAVGSRLDLDVGLARILKDLGGFLATRPGTQTPENPGRDRAMPDAAFARSSLHSFPSAGPRTAGASVPVDGADLIRSANGGSDEAVEGQRLAAGQGADMAGTAELSAAGQSTVIAEQAIPAARSQRPAPLPRQVTLALGTVALDGVACYFAGRALNGSQDTTRACVYTVTTAGFLSLGYRALRAAETPSAWRARRQARPATPAARATADQDTAERDRLIDAYLEHVRRLVQKTYPVERELPVEPVIGPLLDEYSSGADEAWSPSRTLTILYRLRDGSRSAWSRWRAVPDTQAYLASDGTDT